jgi:predicted transglutaminase-like cysteine proteinase
MRNKVFGIIAGAIVAGQMGVAHADVPYMEMLGATSAPIGYVQFCQRQPDALRSAHSLTQRRRS